MTALPNPGWVEGLQVTNMNSQWQIRMIEQSYMTADGFSYQVALEAEDGAVAVSGTVFKSGPGEAFDLIQRNDLLLSDVFVERLIRAICRRLWNSMCEMGVEGINEKIDLPVFLRDEFGNEGRLISEYIARTVRTFELLAIEE